LRWRGSGGRPAHLTDTLTIPAFTRTGVPTRFDNISRDFDKVLFGVNWRFGAVPARYY
jgi:hypothetical protein